MARTFGIGRTLKRSVLWRGSVGTFSEERVELAHGEHVSLGVLNHPGVAAVLPILPDHRIVLIRQYRHPVRATLWEIPAGKLGAGESPSACALRELTEETGYSAGRLIAAGTLLSSPGMTDERVHLFCALDLTLGPIAHELHELIDVEVMTLRRALALVEDGELCDAKTVCALYRASASIERLGVTTQ